MEEKKTIFGYLAQVLVVFGFAMLTLNIFCLAFGDSAKDFSAMFELGNKGIPINVVFQFLCISVLIVVVRFVFFTDTFIKEMPIWLRTICMITAIVILIAAFVAVFHWFPVDMWEPWAMFFLCFGISFAGSYFVMRIKEKAENKQMEEALARLKQNSSRPDSTQHAGRDAAEFKIKEETE